MVDAFNLLKSEVELIRPRLLYARVHLMGLGQRLGSHEATPTHVYKNGDIRLRHSPSAPRQAHQTCWLDPLLLNSSPWSPTVLLINIHVPDDCTGAPPLSVIISGFEGGAGRSTKREVSGRFISFVTVQLHHFPSVVSLGHVCGSVGG